ncbi:hypothetical protein [Sphingomonas faeni]|uniref:hypothetical protein n=1 Tax=Sphingomonas faeni TaxID=185950 RepID=UPI00278057EF|nr:hypothetical protein [Sphingomonas faeni]MDQ0840305.1 hypothetical protein [Sphingomonas faeni]
MRFVEDKGFDDADRIAARQSHEAVKQKLFCEIQRDGRNAVVVGCAIGYARLYEMADDIGGSFASIYAALDDVIIPILKASMSWPAKVFVPFLGHGRLFAVGGGLSTANLYTERQYRRAAGVGASKDAGGDDDRSIEEVGGADAQRCCPGFLCLTVRF